MSGAGTRAMNTSSRNLKYDRVYKNCCGFISCVLMIILMKSHPNQNVQNIHVCRHCAEQRRRACGQSLLRSLYVPEPPETPARRQRLPGPDAGPDTVFLCRKVYDVKLHRILKNPQASTGGYTGAIVSKIPPIVHQHSTPTTATATTDPSQGLSAATDGSKSKDSNEAAVAEAVTN